jgi:hypothetical protein
LIKREVVKLVSIDAHRMIYTRYLGPVFDMKVRAERTLTPAEIESFRTGPNLFSLLNEAA